MFLKWDDTVIGKIDESLNTVSLFNIDSDSPAFLIFGSRKSLSSDEWRSFIEDRIISRSRRDIEKFLFRYGLSFYDPFRIARLTRIINPKDKLWISFDEDECYQNIVQKTLNDIILSDITAGGSSIHSPSGENIKRYGTYNSRFGILKKRYHPFSTDAEAEVAVYRIADRLGIPCCPAVMTDKDTVFSEFLYDYKTEYIVHFRHILKDYLIHGNIVRNILDVRPEYEIPLFQMLVLDYITFQDDRHLSNFAVKIDSEGESFYPLYDNGRSLFFQSREEFINDCLSDVILYSNTFGPVGTYYDHISDMLKDNPRLIDSVDLTITKEEITEILNESDITGYKQQGIIQWMLKTIEVIKKLSDESCIR